jgi:RNA polymerase sigma-70 factor (ECF subfamily)
VTVLDTGAGWVGGAEDDVDLDRDRALVERAQAGDRSAFDALYDRYNQRLWRFCVKRLWDEHEAEDVVQDAFVRAWRALPGFAGERRFYPWLSVIAAHLCSNVVRKRNRADPVAEFPDRQLVSLDDNGEEHVISAAECALAAQAFARLSPRHQHVLNMREGLGWSYQVIAEHEGVRITTVESLLWRARAALRRQMEVQSRRGANAGVVAATFLTVRRWLRGAGTVIERTSAIGSAATAKIANSTAAAATAMAAVFGAILPAAAPVTGGPALRHVPAASTPTPGASLASPGGSGGAGGSVSSDSGATSTASAGRSSSTGPTSLAMLPTSSGVTTPTGAPPGTGGSGGPGGPGGGSQLSFNLPGTGTGPPVALPGAGGGPTPPSSPTTP